MTPKQTKTGHSIQLRIGASRRPSYQLATQDPALAQKASDHMEALARLLVHSGRLAEAHKALTKLGAVADSPEEFAIEVEAVKRLCAEPVSEPIEPGGGITFQQFGEKWTTGTLAREFPDEVHDIASIDDYRQRLEVHYRAIGKVPLSLFGKSHYRAAMAALDSKLGARSRQAYAQAIVRVLNLAVKTDHLEKNPLPEGLAPTVSSDTDFQILYPHEDRSLCGCVRVDFGERFTYGFAIRTGLRVSTLFPLRWRDVNLTTGLLTGRAKDTRSGGKKKRGRTGKRVEFVLQPDLLRALVWWREQRKTEPEDAHIFPQVELTEWAERLRAALLVAGVDRHDLHHDTETGERINFHALRACFVTFALANGRSENWIRERTGHTTSQMIVRYQREHIKALEVKDWLPLDVALGIATPKLEPIADVAADGPCDHEQERAASREPDPRQPLPHAPSATTAAPVVQVNHFGIRQPESGALPAALLAPEGAHEVEALFGAGEVQKFGNRGVRKDARHGGRSVQWGSISPSQGVAMGVATEPENSGSRNEKSGVFDAGTPGWARTTDQLIRNQPSERLVQYESAPAPVSCARDRARPYETPHALPTGVLLLTEGALTELLDLASGARRWHLVAGLGAQLEAVTRAAASAPVDNIAPLIARHKGE